MPEVIGIHLICKNGLNVEELGDGRFKTGNWKVAENRAKTAHYLALHDQKNLPSYKQGLIEKYEHSDIHPDRIIFYVKKSDKPLQWVGKGTGEKGYFWSEK
jgi:hypothetical protein